MADDQSLKLSDLDPSEVTPVTQGTSPSPSLKLSDLKQSDVTPIAKQLPPSAMTAAGRGLEQGATFTTQPVLAGAGAALGQAVTGDWSSNQGRSWNDIVSAYKQMRDAEIDKNNAAQQAHPYITAAATMVGSIPTTIASGGAGGALGQGAAIGAGSYLGESKDPTLKGTAESAAGGAILAKAIEPFMPMIAGQLQGAADMGSQVAKKTLKAMIPETVQQGFQSMLEGINPMSSVAQKTTMPTFASNQAESLTGKIVSARDQLGKDIGDTITTAAQNGSTVNLDDMLDNYQKQVQDNLDAGEITEDEANRLNKAINFQRYQEVPEEEQNVGSLTQATTYAPSQEGDLVPVQMKKTLKMQGATPEDLANLQTPDDGVPEGTEQGEQQGQVSDIARQGDLAERTMTGTSKLVQPATEGVTRGDVPVDQGYLAYKRFQNLTNALYDKDGTSPTAKLLSRELTGNIKQSLMDSVPDFANKLQAYDLYNRYLPETIMAGGEDPTVAQIRYGDTPRAQLQLKQATEDLLTDLNKTGEAGKDAKQTYDRLSTSLDTLNTYDRAMQAQAELENKPYTSIFSRLGLNKDDIMSYVDNQSKRAYAYDKYMNGGVFPLSSPKTVTGAVTDLAGKTGVMVGAIGGLAYNAPKELLSSVGAKLAGNPQVSGLGKALLDAVQSGDPIKRNAAIFAIQQNPTAKSMLDPDMKQTIKGQATPNATAPTGATKYSF